MVLGMVGIAALLPGCIIVLIVILSGNQGASTFGLVFLVLPVTAAVTGNRCLVRMSKDAGSGRGYALAGVTLGWIGIALALLATWGLGAFAAS